MDALAIVMEQPEHLSLSRLALAEAADEDVVVDVEWSGVSTGTERLLWSGRMPAFPGLGYPLVPGYEAVGRVVIAGPLSGHCTGKRVFVPGAQCFGDVRGLFGGAASRVVTPGRRVIPIEETLAERGVLIALAATAYHAIADGAVAPDLIVGHGVLGRLLARICIALGNPPPLVWECDERRHGGANGYEVAAPADTHKGFRSIFDVSGDSKLLDTLIGRLAPKGEIVLAGFYSDPLSFVFPPAFMKEARIRVAAEWRPEDIKGVSELIASNLLDLDGLITHRMAAQDADAAYRTAFGDASCLKMILDWRTP
jgi:bacteriochlorophyllide a dehydrogenase